MVGRMLILRRSSNALCPSIRDGRSVTGRREFKADPLAIAEIFTDCPGGITIVWFVVSDKVS